MSNDDDTGAGGSGQGEFRELYTGRNHVGSFRVEGADDAGTNGSGSEAPKDPEQAVPPSETEVIYWAPQQFKAAGFVLMPSDVWSATRSFHRCGMHGHAEILELLCEYFNWKGNDKGIPPAAFVAHKTLADRSGYSVTHVQRVLRELNQRLITRRPTPKDRKRFREAGLESTLGRGRSSLILQPPELWEFPEEIKCIQVGRKKRETTVRKEFEYRQAHPKEKSRSKRK